jgi:TrmH family RNA methyltransferase
LKRLDRLSVTIVGAEYPVNLGYTARLLKNFGVQKMYLVEPRCDMRVASVYASHGADVLNDAQVVSLKGVRELHDVLVGTTAIKAKKGSNVNRTTVRPEEAIRRIQGAKSSSLVFGRDTTGLRNDELALCDLVTMIDTRTDYKTLNVSHAIAVLLFLASRGNAKNASEVTSGSLRSSKGKRDAFAGYAYQLAVSSGLQDHRADRVTQVARRIALKSNLSPKELGLLVSLMRKADLAIQRNNRESKPRPFRGRRPAS